MTLETLVKRFLEDRTSCCAVRSCCEYEFPPMNSIEDAIKIACRSVDILDKQHSHQWRVRKAAMSGLEHQLHGEATTIAAIRNFDELHSLIARCAKAVPGAGELYVYDVALRIAQGFLSFEPEYVYLHRGAAEGARYLGVQGKKHKLDAFPKAMHKLTPAQTEDFLCICKAKLAAYRVASQ